jgi:hypothetical protein
LRRLANRAENDVYAVDKLFLLFLHLRPVSIAGRSAKQTAIKMTGRERNRSSPTIDASYTNFSPGSSLIVR